MAKYVIYFMSFSEIIKILQWSLKFIFKDYLFLSFIHLIISIKKDPIRPRDI